MDNSGLGEDDEETFYDAEDMDSENPSTTFTPREYQVELINRCIDMNSIIFLPTGSGKTFISVKIIEHFLAKEQGKKCFFLVNTVPLVNQQGSAIRLILPCSVGEYSGDLGVDFWDDDQWNKEITKNQVLVMTAQIFLDLLHHSRVSINNVSVIIFDECHQAVNKHPMRQIMFEVKTYTLEKPRIVGLTATLLNANHKSPKQIMQALDELEETFDATVVRATNYNMVLQFSANPVEHLVYYNIEAPKPGNDLIVKTLNEIFEILRMVDFPDAYQLPLDSPDDAATFFSNKISTSKKLENCLNDVMYISENLGPLCATKCMLSRIAIFERLKLSTDDWITKVLTAINTQLHCLRKEILTMSEDRPLDYCTDKIIKLLDLLKGFKETQSAIVFVDRRSTAQVLSYFMKDVSSMHPQFKEVKPDFIVGFAGKGLSRMTKEGELSRRVNNFVLKQFRKKKVNVLFASNVIEEGVDIPTCNLVIKFDKPITFRSYIQSKGRARHKKSEFIILTDAGYESLYNSFKLTEDILTKKIISRDGSESPSNDDDDDDEQHFYQIGGPDGPKVTAMSSISLLNRYCSKLPQDKFSKLTVEWWLKPHKDPRSSESFKVAFLRLPTNCPIKGYLESPPRKNKQSAMRLVALEACKKLHLLGELDSSLLPYGKDTAILADPHWWPKWQDEEVKGKPGSKKMKRMYIQKRPEVFMSCCPKPNQKAYVHVIKIKPTFQFPATTRLQAFYDLLESSRTFGIITSCKLPEVFPFPLYMNVGEILIEIKMNKLCITLSEEDIDKLKEFHFILFNDALSLASSYVIKDLFNKEDSYLVAPIIYDNDTVELDWNVLNAENQFPEVKMLPFGKRLTHEVTTGLYLNNIVIPWYRSKDETLKYVVTRVRPDLNPDSDFPENNYLSYASYFYEKYDQSVFDSNQPLIEVRAISSKINCIKPRSKRRKKDEVHEETFIPELCYLVNFPAVYALKISLMPSVLHRLTHLLLADELRQTIAKETGLGNISLSKENQWKQLDMNTMTPVVEEKGSSDPELIINFRSYDFNTDKIELVDITRELELDLSTIVYYHKHMTNSPASPERSVKPKSPVVPGGNSHVTVPSLTVLEKTPHKEHGPELRDFVTALTASSADDLFDYERLEILGDSFLKFAASLALYTKFSSKDEGKLTSIKNKTIGNANLFYCGKDVLGSRLKVDQFSPSEWKIPGFTVPEFLLKPLQKGEIGPSILGDLNISSEERKSGQLKDSTIAAIQKLIEEEKSHDEKDYSTVSSNRDNFLVKQVVSDKVVADAVEALICVYLQEFGVRGGLIILEWLGIMPGDLCRAEHLLDSPIESPILPEHSADRYLLQPDILENIIGYKFKDRGFLLQALTHPTASHYATDCYQRLEFLGDAVLDFLITCYIYENCGNLSPGEVTDLRSALVNNITFACLSVRNNLHKHLISMGYALDDAILKFVKSQEENGHPIDSKVLCLVNEDDVKVAGTIDVPKVLGDIFESLAGAIYLDSGRNLNTVWNVVYKLMYKEIREFSREIPINAIRRMYEAFPNNATFGKAEIKDGLYVVSLEVITDRQHVFYGVGPKKDQAKIAAAKLALQTFSG